MNSFFNTGRVMQCALKLALKLSNENILVYVMAFIYFVSEVGSVNI